MYTLPAPGVNLNTHNQATLHTSSNCQMPSDSLRQPQTGCVHRFLYLTEKKNRNSKIICVRTTASTNCDASVNYNSGCGVTFDDPEPSSSSYGDSFNKYGGGWYVMYRGSDSVKVWFYPRDDEGVPEVIRQPGQCGEPILPDSTWGDPDANFPFSSQDCDYDQHFNAHQMVFDLTLCVSLSCLIFRFLSN